MISTDLLSEILSSRFNQVWSLDLNKFGLMENHGQYDAPHKGASINHVDNMLIPTYDM